MQLILQRKIRRSLLSLALLLMAQSSGAYAAEDMYCSIYVKNAVAQNEQNIENKCNYNGVRWNSDPAYHAQWCRDASNESAVRENIARIGQLGKCQDELFPVGADKWCNIYSRVSIGQNTANLSTKCGFSGPTWSSSYSHHYRWCIDASQKLANAQIAARLRELNNCGK